MNKTSKVSTVQASGTWEGSYGLMYKFEISFENGDAGEYSSKNKDQTKFVIGTEAEYTYTGGQHPKVKPVYIPAVGSTGYTPSPDRDLKIVKQSCLKAAVELCTKDKITREQILQIADKFVEWVNAKPAAEPIAESYISAPVQPKRETTDLPF
tara:strand:+ start:260 stop:718 length:459 start_codon:yes stop_codon:yes gene_type:complete